MHFARVACRDFTTCDSGTTLSQDASNELKLFSFTGFFFLKMILDYSSWLSSVCKRRCTVRHCVVGTVPSAAGVASYAAGTRYVPSLVAAAAVSVLRLPQLVLHCLCCAVGGVLTTLYSCCCASPACCGVLSVLCQRCYHTGHMLRCHRCCRHRWKRSPGHRCVVSGAGSVDRTSDAAVGPIWPGPSSPYWQSQEANRPAKPPTR